MSDKQVEINTECTEVTAPGNLTESAVRLQSKEDGQTEVLPQVQPQTDGADRGASGKKPRKKLTKKQILHEVMSWLLMTVGTVMIAVGVYFFKAPNHFATGGVSGLAIVLEKFIPLNQSTLNMIINVLLLIVGFIFLGKGCTLRTFYCSVMYSAENMLLEFLLPINTIPGAVGVELADGTMQYTLTNQPLMELVYAMLLTGIGSAILFNCMASSGGTDIIALILKKYSKMNTGVALLITDSLIALSAFFIFGVEAGLFSMLGLFSKSFIVDGVIENIGKTKYITIITNKSEEIADYILNTMKRDFTSYKATGGYTGIEKTVMVTVCKRSEALRLKYTVKKIDATSFVIITDANEILGKGFRHIQ